MKLFIPILIIAVLLFVLAFGMKLVFTLFAGALNTILGVLVVVALIIIVIWMFSYARKNK